MEDLPWHLTPPPTLCSSLSCSDVLHFCRSPLAHYVSRAHCFPHLFNRQSERGDGLLCRGPGTLLSRRPFPPHTGAPRAIWADSVSPHLLQGEAKPGRSRGTRSHGGPTSRSSHVHLGKTPELQVLSVCVPAARVVPAVSLVRDLASWRHLTSAPTSDAGMHPQEPRGTSLFCLSRSWGHGLPSSGTPDPSSGLPGQFHSGPLLALWTSVPSVTGV